MNSTLRYRAKLIGKWAAPAVGLVVYAVVAGGYASF